MTSSLPFIIYIHGFNSSPASEKARQFAAACQARRDVGFAAPALSHDPQQALRQLETLITGTGGGVHILVGSSLGGYYATYLGEQFGCRAALVNPAVSPVKNLGEAFLGMQKNLYTGEEYEFTREHAGFLDTLDINPLMYPENYLLMVQTGDKVLDYRHAVARYAGSLQVVQEGGSHRYDGFDRMIPAILEFADTGTVSQATRLAVSSLGNTGQPQRKTQKV